MPNFLDFLDSKLFEQYLSEAKLKKPTSIQTKAIPAILQGKNSAFIAETGAGKTLAYALPSIQLAKKWEKDLEVQTYASPFVIVMVPTRELVQQVLEVYKEVAHHAKFRVRALKSGMGRRAALKGQSFEILVTNPGGLLKAVKSGEISLAQLRMVVLDEADQLLDMGFSKEITQILDFHKNTAVAADSNLQFAFVTATRPVDFEVFISDIIGDLPLNVVDLEQGRGLQRKIETYEIQLKYEEKPEMLKTYFKQGGRGSGIVFVNQKEKVSELYEILSKELKRPVFCLHGGMEQKDRERQFRGFREKQGLLIATDIAARGLDIKGVDWVLNYDLPFHPIYYLHRAGRTGRPGGREGKVINFVTQKDRDLVGQINLAIRQQQVLKLGPLKGLSAVTQMKMSKKASKKTSKKASKKSSKKTSKKPERNLRSKTTKKGSKKVAKKQLRRKVKKAVTKRTPRYKRK